MDVLLGLLLPFTGTALGASCVFLIKKEINMLVQKGLLGFASGVMIYVVVEELIPEASMGSHSNIGTIGFSAGFVIMMVLDVALG